MKNGHSIIHYSLLAALVGFSAMPADAGVRVGNLSRSYADAYNQVNAQRAQAQYAAQQYQTQADVTETTTETQLPVRVANATLAQQIARGDSSANVGISNLEACANIYPTGEFAWDRPTLGVGAGGASTCVAVVEMRGYQMGANGSDLVLARANLASGDAVKCNISEFPEASYTVDAMNVVFPADNEPTMDDVIQVMNKEQKQNAGIQIATGVILGGLGGNMGGKNEVGSDSLLGGGKHKTQSTIVGALTGGALMAGNAYAGKVAGDVILSTGVNAAAGAVMGNIVASGDSVLRIEDCKIAGRETTCLWGMIVTNNELDSGKETAFFNIDDGSTTVICNTDMTNCKEEELVAIKLYTDDKNTQKSLEEITETQFEEIRLGTVQKYHLVNDSKGKRIEAGIGTGGTYVQIASAGRIDREIAAMIPDVRDKAFGMKKSDWREWKRSHKGVTIYGRSNRGEAYDLPETAEYDIEDFYPMMVDAEDGGIIDLGNKARLKSTLTGAGIGGALGGFVGYQGAQSDIENRWVTAVREYKDSLQKIYCTTGTRFLGYYNDTIIIPNMVE